MMPYVVRYTFLLISICIKSTAWADPKMDAMKKLIKASGHDIFIECSTDKKPQDGVYMYKLTAANKSQEIFYLYKDNTLTLKNESKVSVSGAFPNLNVTIFNVTVEDVGLFWCEFNWEEKITIGKITALWIEEKDCPEHDLPHELIFLILCIVLFLCVTGFICMLLKVKGCLGKRKYKPSNPPSDSVYEEMKRSNLDNHPKGRTFINPEYQSAKQLR